MSKSAPRLSVIVMAKAPVPGRVKTRLLTRLDPTQAAKVHRVMLDCVIARVDRLLPGNKVLAIDGQGRSDEWTPLRGWGVVQQGDGDLGERMLRVWRGLGAGPAVFVGADSPDVPETILWSVEPHLLETGAVIGPSDDGGYWTIGAAECRPALFRGIDWGSQRVYHQTLEAARRADFPVAELPPWTDVDTPDDLDALVQRLHDATDPDLIRLREQLMSITDAAQ